MQFIALNKHVLPFCKAPKPKERMRLLLIIALLIFSPMLQAQTIALSFKDAPLENVFREIQKQTGYHFIYTRDQLKNSVPVNVQINTTSISVALDACFKNQQLTYTIESKYIIVREKTATTTVSTPQEISGRVVDENADGIEGATVLNSNTGQATATGADGYFILKVMQLPITLTVSNIGFTNTTYQTGATTGNLITLQSSVNTLDETLVIAYGNTTKRLNTGAVSKVTSAEITRQPVGNVLAALHGRVPGLTVTQQNGIPGSSVKLQLRGRTSINASINNDPLIIIDGVPFAPNNAAVNQIGSSLGSGGLSPFNSINPFDIESIEVLKDADATAIYGSRGANGVILITTRKGRAGKTKTELNIRKGVSHTSRTMDYLDTRQYLQMRREAFANDGFVPQANPSLPGYAPDLLLWDTTRYTDFKKLLTGNTANFTDLQLSFSGGNEQTQFLAGSGYHHQTTVFPGSLGNKRASFHLHLNHKSVNKKLTVSFKTSYGFDDNNVNTNDLTAYMRLVPNLPSLYDSTGKLKWQESGVTYENPMAFSLRKYNSKTENLLANAEIRYTLIKGLTIQTNLGLNSFTVTDRSATPIASLNPASNPTGSASFGNNHFSSLIAEPQLHYKKSFGKLKLELLLGATYQQNEKQGKLINATGYNNDALLGSIRAAGAVTVVRSDELRYKYAASFGRINLNWKDRYILNLTGRTDGSSRFGPGKRYANFGALGMAWQFNKESFVKTAIPVLSYGKIRLSHGRTGNDKIGDYAYLNTYTATGLIYQGIPAITPSGLYNADYAWELNKKTEAALETAFFQDRIRFSVAYYINHSSNQLINYALPSQTGGQSIVANFPATVENKGFEIETGALLLQNKKWEWTVSANITIPENRLTAFPGFESSSYASYLVLGEPLNIAGGYRVAGVNSTTGIFEFYDRERKPTPTPAAADRIKNLVKMDPVLFGGITSDVQYRGWSLGIFIEFKKQQGFNYIGNIFSSGLMPGMMYNQPVAILNRWQRAGDVAELQRFTTRSGTLAYNAGGIIQLNNASNQYSDASYMRLKNISLSYSLPATITKKAGMERLRLSIEAQNLFTVTAFKGSDPETQNLNALPVLRTLAAGIQLTF